MVIFLDLSIEMYLHHLGHPLLVDDFNCERDGFPSDWSFIQVEEDQHSLRRPCWIDEKPLVFKNMGWNLKDVITFE